jgi:glycosyltransferase involved in cell wall biosynthesis
MQTFTIILPVYNGGEYIKECLSSILNQTFPHFNVILLENCSTDGTYEWLQKLEDTRLQIQRSDKKLTIEQNWHRIISVQKNEFMTVIGHDDILSRDYLEQMQQLIARHPEASLYQSHYSYIDASGQTLRPCLPMDEVQYAHEFLACHLARTMDSMGTGYMMRSKDYDECGGIPARYPNLIFADYELWIRLTMKSYKATSSNNLFSYRLNESVSKTTNGMQYQEAFKNYIEFIKSASENNQPIKQVITRYGRDMLYYYCEALSHRLLKTPLQLRSITVAEFIARCESYAQQLIPGQEFQPLRKFRIRIAKQLDESMVGRGLFKTFKKLTR